MITEKQRQKNREALIDAIIEETKPEKTGTFHFDGMRWYEDCVLQLDGGHNTPDFMIKFFPGCNMEITRMDRKKDVRTMHVPYSNYQILAKRIVEKTLSMLY